MAGPRYRGFNGPRPSSQQSPLLHQALFSSLLVFLWPFQETLAFDGSSNEMPLDPNNGMKAAYTNDPVLLRPMPHQATEYEKAPYEFWHENKPFVHIHGAEPEHPELRHQHFARSYFDNFNNFITDAPGTGLNVRSIPSDPISSHQQKQPDPSASRPNTNFISILQIQNAETSSTTTTAPFGHQKSADPTIIAEQFNAVRPQPVVVGPTIQQPEVLQPARIDTTTAKNSLHFSSVFHQQPVSVKFAQKLPDDGPNTSAAEGGEEEETKRELAGSLPWDNFKPQVKEFDAYEDIPVAPKRILPVVPPSLVTSLPAAPPQPAVPVPKAIGGGPNARPRLIPLSGSLPKTPPAIKGGWQGHHHRKVHGSTSREKSTPLRVHTEGQPSAIVVGEVAVHAAKSGDSYAKKKPLSSYKATYSSAAGGTYQSQSSPPSYAGNYKVGPPNAPAVYANQQAPSADGCGCCHRPSSNGGNCSPRCGCCSDGCAGGGSCCCNGCCPGNAGGADKCCAGGNGRPLCTLRLIISCCPSPHQQVLLDVCSQKSCAFLPQTWQSCCGRRQLLTSKTRLLFSKHRRRIRRLTEDADKLTTSSSSAPYDQEHTDDGR